MVFDDNQMKEENDLLLEVFVDNGYKRLQGLKNFQNASKGPWSKCNPNDQVSCVQLTFI